MQKKDEKFNWSFSFFSNIKMILFQRYFTSNNLLDFFFFWKRQNFSLEEFSKIESDTDNGHWDEIED